MEASAGQIEDLLIFEMPFRPLTPALIYSFPFLSPVAEYLRNESAFLGELVFGSADTTELSCDSHGSSVPVFWFKDGIGIAPPSRARTGQKLLKIISVSCDGSGLHSCKARHSDQVLGNFTARGTGACRNTARSGLVFSFCFLNFAPPRAQYSWCFAGFIRTGQASASLVTPGSD